MKILLIRHGENKANITREFSCKTVDYPLTEKMRIQAKQTAEALANLKIDKIVSSPLLRAKQTAEAICNKTKSNFEVEEELRPYFCTNRRQFNFLIQTEGVLTC